MILVDFSNLDDSMSIWRSGGLLLFLQPLEPPEKWRAIFMELMLKACTQRNLSSPRLIAFLCIC